MLMPRKRKPKPDDIRLTLHTDKYYARKKAESEFEYWRADAINTQSDIEHGDTSKRVRNEATRAIALLKEYTFAQFVTDYLTSEEFTIFAEEGGNLDEINDFVDHAFNNLYEDIEREARKRKPKVKA
jgi:hypothetical protein